MTLQMAIGKMIVEKIVGHPDEYPEEVVEKARKVIENLPSWDDPTTGLKKENWHTEERMSWPIFEKVAREHNISLPEVLQEEQ